MSNFGGPYDSSSNISTHDDLFDVECIFKGRSIIVLDFSHANDTIASFDCYNDECNTDAFHIYDTFVLIPSYFP